MEHPENGWRGRVEKAIETIERETKRLDDELERHRDRPHVDTFRCDEHKRLIDGMEARMRAVEGFKDRWLGILIAINFVGFGGLATLLIWLIERMGTHGGGP